MTYKCDNSQLFDEERGVCDDAENVVCDIAAKTTTPVTTTVALDLETTTVINGQYCSVGKVFARHPTDCTKYIRCDTNGDAVMVVQCPGYFVFNAQSNICDEPSRVDCATGLEITTTTISCKL
jgi:Chitin binding Peritrophin-A domain